MNIKVKTWYSQYFAQTWYRNSFLVNHPNQIAKALSPPHEWNSINDSGCNITCLAMIIGVDPAHFVSELCRKKFFERDFKRDNGKELRAKHLNNRKIRGFVWDKNKPHKRKPQLIIERVWHPIFNRTTRITIRFHKEIETKDYQEAKEIIRSARKKNLHVICGPDTHSCLVAGVVGDDFFIWDPDDTDVNCKDIIKGKIKLKQIFKETRRKDIQIWIYGVTIK